MQAPLACSNAHRSMQQRPEGQLACRQGAAKKFVLLAGSWALRCAVVHLTDCTMAYLPTCTVPKQYLSSSVFMMLGRAPAGSVVHYGLPIGTAASKVIMLG